jgi:hypothetical protein
MNAPISDTIKAEAAKSLLERMGEKTKLVKFFRYNASAKHGVPIDAEEPINFPTTTPEPTPPTVPIVQSPTIIQPQVPICQPIITQGGLGDKLKGVLATLAALAVVVASVASGLAIGKSGKPEQPPVMQQNQPYMESPFQYLEDQGEHLP